MPVTHESILKLISYKFGFGHLNKRHRYASNIGRSFDFKNPDLEPAELPSTSSWRSDDAVALRRSRAARRARPSRTTWSSSRPPAISTRSASRCPTRRSTRSSASPTRSGRRSRGVGRAVRRALALAAALAALAARAARRGRGGEGRPFVYVVVIDGLDGDRVEGGTAPFISSLLAGQDANATYFPDSRSVMPAVTNANHTAMMSGAYAGQLRNRRQRVRALRAARERRHLRAHRPATSSVLPTQTSGENLTCPQAEFTFEAVKRQGQPGGRRRRRSSASRSSAASSPGATSTRQRRDVDHLWAPCASGPDDDEYCEQRADEPGHRLRARPTRS